MSTAPAPRILTFAADLASTASEFKLFQLPEELLQQIEQATAVAAGPAASTAQKPQAKFIIKGSDTGHVVMCTENKTFVVTKVETSNTLLFFKDDEEQPDTMQDEDDLLEPTKTHATIHTLAKSMYEVTATLPNLLPLRDLLAQCYYQDENQLDASASQDSQTSVKMDAPLTTRSTLQIDTNRIGAGGRSRPSSALTPQTPASDLSKSRSTGQLYTLEMLENALQASKYEILQYLRKLHAMEIDGYWRLLDPKVLKEVLQLIMVTAQAKGWLASDEDTSDVAASIPIEKCVHEMSKSFSARVVVHVLRMFAVDAQDTTVKTIELSFEKIILYWARYLLESQREWRQQAFLQQWSTCLEWILPQAKYSHPKRMLVASTALLQVRFDM